MECIGSLLSVGRNWTDLSPNTTGSADPDHKLRVTFFHDPPYTYLTKHANGSSSFGGYLVELWQTVAEALELPYRMVPTSTRGYGVKNENGTWNGMVGELVYGRADVALSWLYIKPDRALVVDYIDAVAVSESTTGFYAYGSSEDMLVFSDDMFSSLLRPLHVNVWWMLLAALFVLSMALRITLRFNHEGAEDRKTVEKMSWGSCLFSVFRSVMGQGWDTVPDSLAARTVTISTWVLSIIITVSYTANLISHLTVVSEDPPINSLEEFSGKSDWRLAVSPSYSVINDWKTSKDVYERQLYRRVTRQEGFISVESPEKSARLTLQPKVLTYIDLKIFIQILGSDACSLMPLPNFPSQTMGSFMIMAKGNDKMRQTINEAISKIKEAGIIARLKIKWLSAQGLCDAPTVFKPLSFGNLLALMAILPLGFGACVAVLISERSWALWRGNKATKERIGRAWHPMIKSKLNLIKSEADPER